MSLGIVAVLAAAGAALWLLVRQARGSAPGGETRNVTIFKAVIFLGLVAALFAAKLWPLAFMTLIAAGAVTGIEMWRERAGDPLGAETDTPRVDRRKMDTAEAASVLGVAIGASADDVRAAHRKLIAQLHPDKGGNDYLAAKINDARTVLLDVAPAPTPIAEDPSQSTDSPVDAAPAKAAAEEPVEDASKDTSKGEGGDRPTAAPDAERHASASETAQSSKSDVETSPDGTEEADLAASMPETPEPAVSTSGERGDDAPPAVDTVQTETPPEAAPSPNATEKPAS